MKNKLLLSALKWLPKKKGASGILAITTTALGDTLWATPALASLRASFPNTYIAILTNPLGEQILRHNPYTNEIFLIDEWKKIPSFSEIVLLHASQRWILPFATTLGAQRIVGTTGINKGLDSLLTDPIDNRHEHEIIRRLQLVERLGAKRVTEKLSYFLQPEEKIAPQKGVIALHPGSKDDFKRWPKEHFIAVSVALQKRGFNIHITGTKEELPLRQEIAQATGAKLSEDLPLRKFAAYLDSIDLLISNDTGPVHLACALNKPVIALYSPTDPKLCGPHQAINATALALPPTCFPCLKRSCARPFCLMQIGPEEVVNTALKVLKW